MIKFIRAQSLTFDLLFKLGIVIPAKRFRSFYLILLVAFIGAGVDVVLLTLLARFSTIIIASKSDQNFLPGIHIFTGSQSNQIIVTAIVTAVIFCFHRYCVIVLSI